MTGDILNQRLDSILSFIETSMKSGAAFAQDQAPEMIQQLLVWKFYEAVLTIVGCSVLLIVSIIAGYYLTKHIRGRESQFDDISELLYIPVILGVVSGIVSLMFPVSDLLQISFAPKVYLLEYASYFLL